MTEMDSGEPQIEDVVFKPGDILFHENEQSFHFFIIHDGKVEVFKTSPEGQKLPLAMVAEGTSIGEFAMIDRLPRSATARAITEVRASRVSDIAYQKLLSELPDWAVSVMSALVERLRQTNEIIRRHNIVAKEVKREIDAIEYDPDASTLVGTNPFLKTEEEDDNPDLV